MQIQRSEFESISVLLEHVKGLKNQSGRISMTLGNNRISERRLSEGSILMT